jgi:hypothetical protein
VDTNSGAVEGSFTVGARGACSQSGGTSGSGTRYAAMPGSYSLFVGSLSTYIATFRVTGSVTGGQSTAPAKAKPKPKPSHAASPPVRLPFTGPPILQLVLLGGAVLCAGVAMIGAPRAAPAGRHRTTRHRTTRHRTTRHRRLSALRAG